MEKNLGKCVRCGKQAEQKITKKLRYCNDCYNLITVIVKRLSKQEKNVVWDFIEKTSG